MSKSLERRVAAATRSFERRGPSLRELYLVGPLGTGVAKRGSFAGHQVEGQIDEPFETFRERTLKDARVARAKFVVFGGLPANPIEWAEPPGQRDALIAAGRLSVDELDAADYFDETVPQDAP